MEAHLNFKDQPDGTFAVQAVYVGGGPRKESGAHMACLAAIKHLEGLLTAVEGPTIQAELESTQRSEREHRLLILPIAGNRVGGQCSCGYPVTMQRGGNYETDQDASMHDVQAIIEQFHAHAPDGHYVIGPFTKADVDTLMSGV